MRRDLADYAPNIVRILQCPSTWKKYWVWGHCSYGPNSFLTGMDNHYIAHQNYVMPLRFTHPLAEAHRDRLAVVAESIAYNQIMPRWNAVNIWDWLHLQRRNYLVADGNIIDIAIDGPMFFFTAYKNDTERWAYNNHNGI